MIEKDLHTDGNEAELLAQIAGGDASAFALLFDRYYNKVLSHALLYKKSYPEAEDAAQDVFVKVWTNREKLPGVLHFKHYLFILTRNELVDALRKKAVDLSGGNGQVPDLAEEVQLPDKQLELKETQRVILEGMEQLPQQQKLVFRMSRLEGKSNGEIAQALGIAKTTVRWHIALALAFLKAYIARHVLLVSALLCCFY